MGADSLPDEWEVAVGPRDDARFFSVPDSGLQEFIRTLAAQGVERFEISSQGWVFRITRLARPLPREPAADTEPGAKPTGCGEPAAG